MRILALAHDAASVLTSIRLREPLQAVCAAQGWTLRLLDLRECRHDDLRLADVLIVQRASCRRAAGLMRRMRRLGGHVIYEIDDLLTQPAPHLRDHGHLRQCTGGVRANLALADVVTTTTERLAQALRPLARRVELAPNFAPEAPPRAAPWREGQPLTLVLAASDRIAAGVLPEAILRAQAARPGRLKVLCIGLAESMFEGTAVAYRALPMLAREDFWSFLAQEPNAVMLVPLDASPFSACKSAAKFLDSAAVGVPVLCADRPPYSDVVVDGLTGTLVGDSVEDWTAALLAAVDDPQALQQRAALARGDVARRFGLDRTQASWERVLRQLGERRAPVSGLQAWLVRSAERWLQAADTLRKANHARLARRRARRLAADSPAVVGGAHRAMRSES